MTPQINASAMIKQWLYNCPVLNVICNMTPVWYESEFRLILSFFTMVGCSKLCPKTMLPFCLLNQLRSQIREQMSGPDLNVFTLKFLALNKIGFSPINKYFPKFFWLLFTFFILCNFSVWTLKYFQKNFKLIFCP